MKSVFRQTCFVLLSGLALTLIQGCGGPAGPKLIPASGSVTYNSEPVKSGTVGFAPVDATKGRATSATIVNGHYETAAGDGLAAGDYKVIVTASSEMADGVDPASVPDAQVKQLVPSKYGTAETTDLEVTVSESDSKVVKDLELKN